MKVQIPQKLLVNRLNELIDGQTNKNLAEYDRSFRPSRPEKRYCESKVKRKPVQRRYAKRETKLPEQITHRDLVLLNARKLGGAEKNSLIAVISEAEKRVDLGTKYAPDPLERPLFEIRDVANRSNKNDVFKVEDNTSGAFLNRCNGNFEIAIKQYRIGLDTNPNDYRCAFNLGYALAMLGKDSEAIAAFNLADTIRPNIAQCEFNKAICYIRLRKYNRAFECIERAIEKEPENLEFITARAYLNRRRIVNDDSRSLQMETAKGLNDFVGASHDYSLVFHVQKSLNGQQVPAVDNKSLFCSKPMFDSVAIMKAENLDYGIRQKEKQTKRCLRIASKPAEDRTMEEVEAMKEFFNELSFFSTLSDQMKIQVCKKINLETYGPNKIVFRQGDEGDKFYVILNGSVNIFQKEKETKVAKKVRRDVRKSIIAKNAFQKRKSVFSMEEELGSRVNTCTTGHTFGEWSIVNGAPRNASVKTVLETRFLTLSRQHFQEILLRDRQQNLRHLAKFIKKNPLLALLKDDIITQLSKIAVETNYFSGQVILRQGDKPFGLYLVRKGTCRAVTLDFKNKNSSMKPKECLVSNMAAGDYFGDDWVLGENDSSFRSSVTVICSSVATIVVIPKRNLYKETTFLIREELRKNRDALIKREAGNSESVEKKLLKARVWARYKKSLLEQIIKSK